MYSNTAIRRRGCYRSMLQHVLSNMHNTEVSKSVACLPSYFVKANYTLLVCCWGSGTVDQRTPRHNLISLSFKTFSTLRSNPGFTIWTLTLSTGLQLVFNVHQSSMWESLTVECFWHSLHPAAPQWAPVDPLRSLTTQVFPRWRNCFSLTDIPVLGNTVIKVHKAWQTTLALPPRPLSPFKHGVHPVTSHAGVVI